ncbi:Starch-binding associating with outer membrane [Pedobacter terrae]|uniref:Starch-binding associating with outer membrane n=1 Tax=Pedobacter terrae TaxID=405671 RepID=A0A1G7XZ35_9SPHI|nr:SusD/RagB family nutrient-binding outer membrane lipoprotein [Pedobacter terrae]SDG89482.1 Starch-binding associating with outer membrane [Pedobacter terrae]
MKNKIIIASLISGMFLSTSCKKYLDVNKDPNNPTKISAASRLVGAITTSNGAALWRGIREVSGLVQYGTTKLLTGTNRNAEQWRFTASYFLWQNAYVYTMPNCVDVINLGEEEGSPYFVGAGKTLLAMNFGLLTDQYGSIVVDDYYNGKTQLNLLPKMQTQQEVYQRIDKLLDEAIVAFSSTTNATGLNANGGDIMFQGDVSKWKRFAWALKARYLNHLSKKGALYNSAKIIEACNNAFNADGMDAQFPYLSGGIQTDENPWYSWGGFVLTTTDPNNSLYDPRYFAWSQFFVNMLSSFPVTNTTFQDPRISRIMQPAASDGQYRGLRAGAGLAGGQGLLPNGQPGDATKTDGNDYGRFSNSGFYTKQTSPIPFITYSEVKLIEAEARLRANDVAGALAAYEEGIKANMRKLGVTTAEINTYWTAQLADGLVAHFGNLTQGLSHIMRQKYITLCLNPETWVDMRRSDFSQAIYGPSLVRPVNLNTVVFDANNASQWIRGMVYESNEQTRNPQAVGDNSEKYRLLTPLWWDTN